MQFGVDEAGKGPVLGSMFAAAVVADPDRLPGDVADSKRLEPARRAEIAAALEDDPEIDIGVAEIPVSRIDDPETDMNSLTVAAQAQALSLVAEPGLAGHVDAGDTSEERFARRLEETVDADLTIRAEHGADERYPVVSAASVVAKVRRDAHVAALAESYDRELGSGYPSDPTTREFLSAYLADTGELPDCARRSWKTCHDLLADAEQTGLAEF